MCNAENTSEALIIGQMKDTAVPKNSTS